jgi:hypothetical protein
MAIQVGDRVEIIRTGEAGEVEEIDRDLIKLRLSRKKAA